MTPGKDATMDTRAVERDAGAAMLAHLERGRTTHVAAARQEVWSAYIDAVEGRSELDHLDKLALSIALAQSIEGNTRGLVERARAKGSTWEQVGNALGITRQAACQKYGS